MLTNGNLGVKCLQAGVFIGRPPVLDPEKQVIVSLLDPGGSVWYGSSGV